MSLPFKFYSSDERTYSLFFEEQMAWDNNALKVYFQPLFPQLEELTHTFNSLNFLLSSPLQAEVIRPLLEAIDYAQFQRDSAIHCWEIPICLDKEYTQDVLAHFKGEVDAVQRYLDLFLATTFELEFYGFLPGFGYLSGLPKSLILPRKSTPNRVTKKGTVAVGGAQVGIYPQDSPGGWQGVGYCPVPWFSPKKTPPFFVQMGDAVRFISVDKKQCDSIALSVAMQVYIPKKVSL